MVTVAVVVALAVQPQPPYMESSEHEQEKQHSRIIKPEDEEAINEKKAPSAIENQVVFTEAPAPGNEKREYSKN